MDKPVTHPRLDVEPRSGDEPFVRDGRPVGLQLLDFWRWSASDLIDNATRGVLAEFLVAQALGCATRPRGSWDSYDLVTSSGIKVEVKSASPWQTWGQPKPSSLSFGIQPTHGWSTETGEFDSGTRRHADVYVFAVLKSGDKSELDPLNLDQWTFHVLPARVLNERVPEQKSIALGRLGELGAKECTYETLRSAVEGSA